MPHYLLAHIAGGNRKKIFTGGKWKKILHGIIEKKIRQEVNLNSPILQGINSYFYYN
jgi:hypothetical protein